MTEKSEKPLQITMGYPQYGSVNVGLYKNYYFEVDKKSDKDLSIVLTSLIEQTQVFATWREIPKGEILRDVPKPTIDYYRMTTKP